MKIKNGILILLAIVVWAACGYFNYGYTLGHFTYNYPSQDHHGFALFMAVMGPFGVPTTLLEKDGHWTTHPYTKEERWDWFHKLYPHLTRENFEGYEQ